MACSLGMLFCLITASLIFGITIGGEHNELFVRKSGCNDNMCAVKVVKGKCFVEGSKPNSEGWYQTRCDFGNKFDFNTTIPCHYEASDIPRLHCGHIPTDLTQTLTMFEFILVVILTFCCSF